MYSVKSIACISVGHARITIIDLFICYFKVVISSFRNHHSINYTKCCVLPSLDKIASTCKNVGPAYYETPFYQISTYMPVSM